MAPSRRARSLSIILALVVWTSACSGSDQGGAEWRQIGDIDHLLADDLPDGWVVSTATLRPGRPAPEWSHRSDVFVDDERDSIVVVTASQFTPPGGVDDLPPGAPPGDPIDVDVEDLWSLLAYSGVAAPEGATARQVQWRSGSVSLGAIRIAHGPPEDALLRAASEALADADDLDFDHPEALRDAGFTLASTVTDTEDVTDYTITWAHRDDAGRSREQAREASEAAPRLWLNVGARMYVPALAATADLAASPEEGEVRHNDESLELTFLRDGLPVTIGGSGVEPEALRALALSLRELSFERWTTELGDRLLVDEPEAREARARSNARASP